MTRKKSSARIEREIADALAKPRRHHVAKADPKKSRWNHADVARIQHVPEDVVRRIYATVQTAKRQGLAGGHLADLIERMVGRRLVGGEYTVVHNAKEHLDYNPPGGYSGPQPKGSAKAPPRPEANNPKIRRAGQLITSANATIKDVLKRRKHATFGWDATNDSADRALLRHAADELDVAGDLYEEAGAGVSAGTFHERAKHARRGDYKVLEIYD